MTTLLVTYAGDVDTRFDRDYWIERHLPLVREVWGPLGLRSVAGFFPAGDGAGIIAIAPCVFRDEAAMTAALAAPQSRRVMDDIRRFTDVEPSRSRAVVL